MATRESHQNRLLQLAREGYRFHSLKGSGAQFERLFSKRFTFLHQNQNISTIILLIIFPL